MIFNLKKGFILFLGVAIVFFLVFIISVFSCGISSDLDFVSWIYYSFSALGHAALLSFFLFLVFYLPLALLFKKSKIASLTYVFSAIILQFVLILDSYVFDIYKFHINGFVIEMLLAGGASDIFVFDSSLYFKFFGIIFLCAVLPMLVVYFFSKRKTSFLSKKNLVIISLFLIFCIIISHIGNAVARAINYSSVQKSITTLPLFFPLTANSLLKKIGIIDVNEFDFQSYNKESSDLQYPLRPLEISDSVSNYNILYLLIDSWNPSTFDSISTPNIYKFSKKGQVFEKHYSSNYATRGGVFGLFFGLSLTYENEFNISKMSPAIIDRLIDLDYDINAFPSATFVNPPFNEIIYRRIPNITINTKGDTPFERDQQITDNFLSYLDTRKVDKPFFSFIFYDLAHAMSLPADYKKKFESDWNSPDYLSLNNKMDRTPFFNLYRSCVYRTDILIGEILDKMESQGLLENTIVVITGDHGQEFNENKKNYWGHGSDFSKWQLQVPFVMYYPSIEPEKEIRHMTTHYDVSSTILNRFFGIKNNSQDYSMGYDLWNDTTRYPHVVGDHVNYGFVLENLILKTGHIGLMEITDRDLNPMSRDAIDIKSLQKSIERKNKFYKK